jgi:hypothetical protein
LNNLLGAGKDIRSFDKLDMTHNGGHDNGALWDGEQEDDVTLLLKTKTRLIMSLGVCID